MSFILNEDADALSYSINGGANVSLTATKGTHSFTIAPGDKFSIQTYKNELVGYSIPTGGTVAQTASGLSQPTNASGLNIISSDSNPLVRFNSPRGVSVSNNPNSGNFGSVYITNTTPGTTTGVVRSVGRGLYALRADQSDAFGYGNTAQNPGSVFDTANASSPYRTFVSASGEVYAADWSDAKGNVWRLNSTLTTNDQLFAGTGGPSDLPAGQNHGSTTSVFVEGSSATGDLVVYTIDEDLTTNHVTGSGATNDSNSLWRYDINGASIPFGAMPTRVNLTNNLLPAATTDMERGADGKFYTMQTRSAGSEAGIVVLDPSGATVFDSLTATRALLGNPTAKDIFWQVQAIAVSPDQQWLATLQTNNTVAVTPLISGIPDIANRLAVASDIATGNGRDIAFDAAGNIHYVSSGQALYRVLSPGGETLAVTNWDGSSLGFAMYVPEPASGALLCVGLMGIAFARRREN